MNQSAQKRLLPLSQAMLDLNQNSPFIIPSIISLFSLLVIFKIFTSSSHKKVSSAPQSKKDHLPKAYPVIGSSLTFLTQPNDLLRWTSEILQFYDTFVLYLPFNNRNIFTANPANVEHILKSHFNNYPKGSIINSCLRDFLGHGIFNIDGQEWKFQRQVASHEFNTKSLRNFIEHVVDTEMSSRLMPILMDAAKNKTVIDLQDILKRFAFDNICRIAFGYDPEYLSASLPQAPFAVAFEEATMISGKRIRAVFPPLWKIKRVLGIGSESHLKKDVKEIRELAQRIVRQKKAERENHTSSSIDESDLDLLSRFLNSGHNDEAFVTDIVISFILAGRDTTSAALTWFFWLLSKNPEVESEILKEIAAAAEQSNNDGGHRHSVFDKVKGMEYTHAALCESMRLYPPVPMDTKEAAGDDVLPDGTNVKKGMKVTYHVYAMGRSEKIWGKDWAEYKPERWLSDAEEGKRRFVARDPYSYPVFQAGPRVCLGKEMAFLQMKRIVSGVLGRFTVVPVLEDGFEPVFLHGLTSVMQGSLPVRIEERSGKI